MWETTPLLVSLQVGIHSLGVHESTSKTNLKERNPRHFRCIQDRIVCREIKIHHITVNFLTKPSTHLCRKEKNRKDHTKTISVKINIAFLVGKFTQNQFVENKLILFHAISQFERIGKVKEILGEKKTVSHR